MSQAQDNNKIGGKNMNRESVRSSNIKSIGYDLDSRILEIEFLSGGIYQYFDVPESVYKELMSAQSHGSFFHQNIKNRYQWTKV
jgi:hypothetical protein